MHNTVQTNISRQLTVTYSKTQILSIRWCSNLTDYQHDTKSQPETFARQQNHDSDRQYTTQTLDVLREHLLVTRTSHRLMN